MPRKLLLCVVLFLIVSVVFWQIIRNDFINFDDPVYIYENPHVSTGISFSNSKWAFSAIEATNWHPLTWLSHQADVEIFGLNPAGHHFTSLILHAFSTVLLFLFFTWATGSVWKSFFVAGLFALHPLHVESVAWAAERKDVLSGLLFMLTLLAYAWYTARPTGSRYCLVIITYICGLMAKPMLVTLPFLLLLLDYWPFGRVLSQADRGCLHTSIGRAVLEKLPLLAFTVVSVIITLYAQGQGGAVSNLQELPFSVRLVNAVVSPVRYIAKTVYPNNLSILYPYEFDYPLWKVAASGVILIVSSALTLKLARKSPFLFVGWFWFLGMLIPVIGLVQIGSQSIADRYTYLPLIGIFVMVAWGVPQMLCNFRCCRQILPVLSVLVFMVLTPLTFFRIADWRDSITILSKSLQTTTNNPVLHHNLGIALAGKGKDNEAIVHYKEAIRIDPWYKESYYSLGNVLMRRGNYAEALMLYSETTRLDPMHAMAYNNAGVALKMMGRNAEAIVQLQEAVRLAPTIAGVRYNLAEVLLRSGRRDEAAQQCTEVLRVDPNHMAARAMLSFIYSD